MNNKKLLVTYQILKAKLLKQRKPLFVGWALTNQCNCKCYYCLEIKNDLPELNTRQIFSRIDLLKSLGTLRINFTGGEPLLRDDLEQIVEYTRSKNISVSLSSNGILFPEKFNFLKNKISGITLACDGPKEIHDQIKGPGTHARVLTALDLLKDSKIKVLISVALSKENTKITTIDYILKIAESYQAKIIFQPAVDYSISDNNPTYFSPQDVEYQRVLQYIIHKKKMDKKRVVFNSLSTLRILQYWPLNKKVLNCPAGHIYCRIRPDGAFCLCGWESEIFFKQKDLDAVSMRKSLDNLKKNKPYCTSCWCSQRIELTQIWNFNLNSIINAIQYF